MNPEDLKQHVQKAFYKVIGGIDFEHLSKGTGKSVKELREKAVETLLNVLNRFPNVKSCRAQEWLAVLDNNQIGTYYVELHYIVETSTALIFDINKINEAAKLGILDDDGEFVDPPPVCLSCHQPFTSAEEVQTLKGHLEAAVSALEWRIENEPETLDKSDHEKLDEWKQALAGTQ